MSRGANVIPPSQLEGEINAAGPNLRQMVMSAYSANMNMLRVWGGGAPLPDDFYSACDEYGILVYHDLFLVEEHNHGPLEDGDVDKVVVPADEISELVRATAWHPCVVVYDGCNECTVVTGTSTEIYATFVMKVVGEIVGLAVPIWPSCPGKGWDSGVHPLNSTYAGGSKGLTAGTVNKNEIEVHGPYTHGGSVANPQTNGLIDDDDDEYMYDPQLPVVYKTKNEVGVK
jgi:hypothetical protein